MKTSTLALIGISAGAVATGFNIWTHNWLTMFWAGASSLWALLAYDLAKKLGK